MFVLNKLLYKPVLSMIEKRKKAIEDGVKQAQISKTEDEKMQSKRQKTLDIARKDAQNLLEKAKKDAAEEAKSIIAQAHKEGQDLIKKRRSEMDDEYVIREKEIRAHAVEIATLMVERLIPEILSGDNEHQIINQKLHEMEHLNLKV